MPPETLSSYLRLSQFLDLESKWLDVADRGELCHRICQTVVILLHTPAAAIGLAEPQQAYRVLADVGEWSTAGLAPDSSARGGSSLVRRALASRAPQLKSRGESSVGVFPFDAGEAGQGCLQIEIDRPIFEGVEVSFLRFVASLSGIMVAGGAPPVEPAARSDATAAPPPHDEAREQVAMAVHDLRNPLSVLSGYVELLSSGSLGALGDDQRRAVDAIGRQTGIALTAIEHLLETERRHDAEAVPTALPFDLRAMFEELHETRFPHTADRIRWPGAESAFEFTTERARVLSVVQNLVGNALEHGGSGEITVECTRERTGGTELVIQVGDRGPGLEPSVRASLTDPKTPPPPGTGLHAAVSQLRALGGSLSVSDRNGGGTLIEIRVPADEKRR